MADPTPCPEELVRRASDPAGSDCQRNHALRQLEPLIREVARGVAASCSPYLGQDLEQEAFSHVGLKLHRFRDLGEGSFVAWLYRVLRHLAVDLRRKLRGKDPLSQACTGRMGSDEAPDPLELAEAAEKPNAIPDLEQQHFAHMRSVLNKAVWPRSGAIDYFAVFLLHLRLSLAAGWRRALGEEVVPGEVAERVAAWLPWWAEEERRTIRAELPTLAELWQAFAPVLDRRDLQADHLLDVLRQLRPQHAPLRETWHQWMLRARRQAQQHLTATDWNQLFAPCLGQATEEQPFTRCGPGITS